MYRFFRENFMTTRYLSTLCAGCFMVVFVVPSAASSPLEKEGSKQQVAEFDHAEPIITRSMRVIFDPETGEIISIPFRGSGETLPAPLSKALTRSTEGLQVFGLEAGGGGVHLDGRYQHVLMVRVKPDGSFETFCTNHPHEAENFLKGTAAGTKPASRNK